MFCGILVGFVLLVLCPVFERIPMNVLGAIIIVGVAGGARCLPYTQRALRHWHAGCHGWPWL
jgi:MFS superfamily sulfate permease-like transporter